MNKTIALATIILLLTPLAQSASVVEIRIEKLYARADFNGEIRVAVGNDTFSSGFSAQAGRPISFVHAFRGVELGTADTVDIVSSTGDLLFHATASYADGTLRLENSSMDPELLSLNSNETSLRYVVGGVVGDFVASVHFRSAEAARGATVNITVNNQTSTVEAKVPVVNATVHVIDSPVLTTWAISVVKNGTTYASYTGAVDFLDGSFDNIDREVVDPNVADLLVSIDGAAHRSSIAGVFGIPNDQFVKAWKGQDAGGDLPDVGLALTFGSPEKVGQPASVPPTPEPPLSDGVSSRNIELPGLPISAAALVVAAVSLFAIALAIRQRRLRYEARTRPDVE